METLLRDDNNNPVPVMKPDDGITPITTSGVSQATNVIDENNDSIVRIAATSACYVAVGETPVATSGSMLLFDGMVDYIKVLAGEKIAVLQISGAGAVNFTRMI